MVGYTLPMLDKFICSHEKRLNRFVYEMALNAYPGADLGRPKGQRPSLLMNKNLAKKGKAK